VLLLTFTPGSGRDLAPQRGRPMRRTASCRRAARADRAVKEFLASRGIGAAEFYRWSAPAHGGERAAGQRTDFADERAKRLSNASSTSRTWRRLPATPDYAGRWFKPDAREVRPEEGIRAHARLDSATGSPSPSRATFEAKLTRCAAALGLDGRFSISSSSAAEVLLSGYPATYVTLFAPMRAARALDELRAATATSPWSTSAPWCARCRAWSTTDPRRALPLFFTLGAGCSSCPRPVATEDERRREAAVMRVYARRARRFPAASGRVHRDGRASRHPRHAPARDHREVIARRVFELDCRRASASGCRPARRDRAPLARMPGSRAQGAARLAAITLRDSVYLLYTA